MIYIVLYNSTACRVTRWFRTSDKTLLSWMFSYASICLLYRKNTVDLIAGTTLTRAILRLPSNIFVATKWCTLQTVIIYLKSSHIRRVAHCYIAIVKTATSFSPILSYSTALTELIALSSGDNKKMFLRGPLEAHRRILVLRVILMSEPPFKTVDLHLFLSREKARGSRQATKFSCLDNQWPSWSQNLEPINRI